MLDGGTRFVAARRTRELNICEPTYFMRQFKGKKYEEQEIKVEIAKAWENRMKKAAGRNGIENEAWIYEIQKLIESIRKILR